MKRYYMTFYFEKKKVIGKKSIHMWKKIKSFSLFYFNNFFFHKKNFTKKYSIFYFILRAIPLRTNVYKFHLFINFYNLFTQGFSYIANVLAHMSTILAFIRDRTIRVSWCIRNLCENIGNNVVMLFKVRRIQGGKYFTRTLFTHLTQT